MPPVKKVLETRRDFIVLPVRGLSFDGYRTVFELPDEAHPAVMLALHVAHVFFAQPLPQQPPDADANQPVGKEIALKQTLGQEKDPPLVLAGERRQETWA